MTPIPAKVVNVDRSCDEFLVSVWVGCESFQGSFDSLSFGEIKPYFGSYHYGWLDVAFRQNPGLKTGQEFPLWATS